MRKNVKQQLALRVLSTAALMAMVSSIATAAFADTYDLNKGSVTVETKANGVTYVTQKDDKQEDGFARNKNNEILNEHPDDTGVTITSGGEKTSNTITVETAKDQTTDVTLDNVHIEVDTAKTKSGAIEIKGDGDTNLELNGDNTVLVKNEWSEEHAAIEKADKYGKEGTLTIKDDLNDDGSEKRVPMRTLPASCWQAATRMVPVSAAVVENLPILPTLPSPAVRSLPAAVITAQASAAAMAEMHRISALKAMHMLPPLLTVVLPLVPVNTVPAMSPSLTMPLWMLLADVVLPLVLVIPDMKPLSRFLVMQQ